MIPCSDFDDYGDLYLPPTHPLSIYSPLLFICLCFWVVGIKVFKCHFSFSSSFLFGRIVFISFLKFLYFLFFNFFSFLWVMPLLVYCWSKVASKCSVEYPEKGPRGFEWYNLLSYGVGCLSCIRLGERGTSSSEIFTHHVDLDYLWLWDFLPCQPCLSRPPFWSHYSFPSSFSSYAWLWSLFNFYIFKDKLMHNLKCHHSKHLCYEMFNILLLGDALRIT